MKISAKVNILLFMFLFSAGLWAENNFTIESLMQLLAEKDSSSATFVEYRHSSMLTKPVRITGKLFYKKPDILIKETTHPEIEKLKIIADRVEYEKLENGKKISRTLAIEDFPFLESMVVGLRATFAGDINKLNKFYKIKLSGNKADWKLELNTKSVLSDPDELFENSIKRMIITGSVSEFRKIEMYDADGEKTVINISPF